MNLILEALYFFLPGFVANMFPVLVKNVDFLNYPVSEKLFGDHKTVRGYLFGVLAGVFVAWGQFYFGWEEVYLGESFLVYGGLMGFGALLGDTVKSYFKRRLGRGAGTAWFPFDQLDFVVGGLALVSFVVAVKIEYALVLFLITPVLHRLVNWVAYSLGLKEVPY